MDERTRAVVAIESEEHEAELKKKGFGILKAGPFRGNRKARRQTAAEKRRAAKKVAP